MSHRREGDLAEARAAIAEHARRFPHGLLAPERERLTSELE
jgi:TolA-binding protein